MVGVELTKQMGRWTAHRMSPDAMVEAFIVRTMEAVAVVRWRIRRKPSSIGTGTVRHRAMSGLLCIFLINRVCMYRAYHSVFAYHSRSP